MMAFLAVAALGVIAALVARCIYLSDGWKSARKGLYAEQYLHDQNKRAMEALRRSRDEAHEAHERMWKERDEARQMHDECGDMATRLREERDELQRKLQECRNNADDLAIERDALRAAHGRLVERVQAALNGDTTAYTGQVGV